ITLECWHHNAIRKDELIGACTFGFSRVYSLVRHTLLRQWMPLTFPEKPGDVRGYVNVSVGIYGPGDDYVRCGLESRVGVIVTTIFTALEVPSGFRLVSDEDEAVSSITERVLQTPDSKFNL
ncbi:hypothetical protein FOZ62_011864, partial [Perkinsus olseni]